MTSKPFAALSVLVGLGLSPIMVTAQIAGNVVDSADRPLSGVLVRAWGTGEVLAAVETDESGRFTLEVTRSHVRRLTAHAAGAPAVFVHDLEPPIRIEVATQPVELAGLNVQAEREICAMPDDPQARALLASATAGLSSETGMRGLGWGPRDRSATSPTPELPAGVEFHRPAEAPTDFIDGWAGVNGSTWGYLPFPRGTFEERVLVEGYAAYEPLTHADRPRLYPLLHGPKAYHFGTPAFVQIHDFAVLDRDGDEAVLQFCPRSEQPGIRGRIYIRGDRLESADWAFLDADGEPVDAGGSVEFRVVMDAEGQRHLLAQSGQRWAESLERPGYYDVAEIDYRYWQISPTAKVPLTSATRR